MPGPSAGGRGRGEDVVDADREERRVRFVGEAGAAAAAGMGERDV
jgi:hypothetical protein